jgi:hypothetical protein
MAKIRTTRVTVHVDDDTRREINKRALEVLEAQALSGRDKTGGTFPEAKGPKAINLHSDLTNSRLWSEVDTSQPGQIVFRASHAEHVLPKYRADGLNPQSQRELEEQLRGLLNEKITVLDDRIG